ncbi:MAG: hypothetical protein H6684_13505 [Deltaproteobacteria bacterium]|nr:hypothetical protein [Deltaproteobacteria bacterium]
MTIRLIFLLFPGIVAWVIVERLTAKEDAKTRDIVFFVVIYAVLSYLFYYFGQAAFRRLGSDTFVPDDFSFFTALLSPSQPIDVREVAWTSVVAVLMGIGFSIAVNQNVFYRIMRRVGASRNIGFATVWDYAFAWDAVPTWVAIRDHANNLVYYGEAVAISDYRVGNGEILLSKVKVSDNETGERLYELEFLYLSREKGDWTVEFIDRSEGTDEIVGDSNV